MAVDCETVDSGSAARDSGRGAWSSGECNGDVSGGMGKPAVELGVQYRSRELKL